MNAVENHLIDLLPAADRNRILVLCEPVELVLSEVLCEPGKLTRHVYFPTQGYISLVTSGRRQLGRGSGHGRPWRHAGRATGAGRGNNVPLHALVQGPGTALRIATAPFKRELARSAALRRGLHRYLYVLMAQQASSAACLRFHLICQRLARWLLISQDRARSNNFHLTHEFLARMLGMHYVGITAAASALQRDGLIQYRRGEITALDRCGLEAAACSWYATSEQTYNDLLRSDAKASSRQKPPGYVR